MLRMPAKAGLLAKWLIGTALSLSVAGTASLSCPSVAHADELEDLEHEMRDIRDRLSEAQTTYMDSLRIQEESARRVEEEKATLDDIQGKLDAQQESLSSIIKMEYTYGSDTSMLSVITSSENLTEMTETMDYLRGMENKKVATTTQVLDLRNAQAEVLSALEHDEQAAKEAAERADADQRDLEGKLEEMRPRINDLMGEVKARLNGSSGSTQLQEAMSFLENIDGINETQAAIVRSAYRTGYAGWGRCEAWAEAVYRNAGSSIGSYSSAYTDYSDNFVSDDYDIMPAGALCYGSGTSGPYSHVGVCVFNGGGGPETIYVMDNEGSRSGKAVTLTEWLKWQTAVSWNNGRSGWFGWGYPDGTGIA